MEIELRCPACRARQSRCDTTRLNVYCRRCNADLSLLLRVIVKVMRLRTELSSVDLEGVATADAKKIRNELKLWDPAGRVE